MNLKNRMLMEGDNLEMMRSIDSCSFDLVSTDPPFYGKEADISQNPARSGRGVHWHDKTDWTIEVDEAEYEVNTMSDQRLRQVVDLAGAAEGREFACFMAYMSVRIREMHRVLKDDGIISWHCDYAASAYLKLVFDVVFGYDNLLNELIWRRMDAGAPSRRLANNHDTILIYHKGDDWTWNPIYGELPNSTVANYRKKDRIGRWAMGDLTAPGTSSGGSGVPWHGFDPASIGDGRHWSVPTKGAMGDFIVDRGLVKGWPDEYGSSLERLEALDEAGLIHWSQSGRPWLKRYLESTKGRKRLDDVMIDVARVGPKSSDDRRFRDQKPPELYRRIISATTNESDWVLDPFSGCGTTLNAAEDLKRNWVGIDRWEGAYDTSREWFNSDVRVIHVTEPLSRMDDGRMSSEMLLTKPKRVPLERQTRKYTLDKVIPPKPEIQKCAGCDGRFNRNVLTRGHKLPISKGGEWNVGNLVPLCEPCNQLQGNDLTLSGLRRELKRLNRMAWQITATSNPSLLI